MAMTSLLGACGSSGSTATGGATTPDAGSVGLDAAAFDSAAFDTAASDTAGSDTAKNAETTGASDVADSTSDATVGDVIAPSDAAAGADASKADVATDGSSADASAADVGPTQGYNGAPVPLAELANVVATEMCKANAAVCPPAKKLPFVTQAGCESGVKSADAKDFAELAAMVATGALSYDAAKAGECLAVCTANCYALDFVDGPPACQAVFQGKAKDGASCKFNVSCASGYCIDNDTCPGTCKARVVAGGKCGDDDKCVAGHVCFGGKCVPNVAKEIGTGCGTLVCKSGAYCDSATDKCLALHNLGQKCPDVNTCKPGLQCIDAGSGGVCVPMPTSGEACYVDVFSDPSTQCAKGLVCFHDGEADTGVCQTQVAFGQPCENSSQCGGWDVRCIGATGSKTCQPLAGKGSACEVAKLEFGELTGCLEPFTCQKGVCVEPPLAGQPCADDLLKQCAADLYCDPLKNVCVPQPAAGEACYGLCKEGLECDQPVSTKPGVCKSACP
jgi:hypothetical protein